MSISSTNSRNNYTGNNSTDTYNYTFRILDQDDLLVTVRDTSDVETTLAITTDYTVTGVGAVGGGTIVLVAGNLATGYILSIRRVVSLVQETDIRNQGAFYPEIHEDQFDRQVMMAQQQQDEVDRSVKLIETIDPADFDTRLPASIVGAINQTVMTNATGDGFEPGPTADEVSNAQGYATAATASQVAAAASASAAAASASAAALSALSAAASQWNDVQYLTSASSPFTVTDAMAGTMFEVDCTSGSVTINLPAISALTLSGPWSIGIKKTDSSANTVTASRNGTDTIDGSTTKVISRQYGGFVLVPDIDQSPDKWTSISFGEVPIAGAIVGTTDAQTLTNKTFGDAQITTDISTPSNPSAGFKKLYSKSDGVYSLDSSGNERILTAKAPTVQKFTSGSGTYTKATGALYIEVELIGGGGGGGGTGTGSGTGGTGGNTTFGTTVLVGNGGVGGSSSSGITGGAGGTSSLSGSSGQNIDGGHGGHGALAVSGAAVAGGSGAYSAFGGAGSCNLASGAGFDARTNSGSGGGGAQSATSGNGGGGGGSGGYARAFIFSPSASYSYAVGAAGTSGSAGTGGFAGGAGGSGIIVVREYYS